MLGNAVPVFGRFWRAALRWFLARYRPDGEFPRVVPLFCPPGLPPGPRRFDQAPIIGGLARGPRFRMRVNSKISQNIA